MYAKQPKKMLIMNILDILRQHTDEEHCLNQREIVEILEKEYDMKVDRKAVKRNLMNLIEFGYDINCKEHTRANKQGEEETICTDWYMNREFTDAELRLLIDGLLFSKHIPYSQCKELIQKIEGLSSKHFQSKVKHICNLPADMPENKELFYTIEILDEAIEKNRQVEFFYGDFASDKKRYPRLDQYGKIRKYVVNPYQMVATNGRYYLIGNYDKYNNVSHYRVDYIMSIKMTDTPAKPQREVEGLEYGLNLPKHMAEHVYMFSGESEHVVMRASKDMASEFIDWFGAGVRFVEDRDNMMTIHVNANTEAMQYWALQYAPYVTVISPQSLVDKVSEGLQKALIRYEEEARV